MAEHFPLNYLAAMLELVPSVSPFFMAAELSLPSGKLSQGTPLGGFYLICVTNRFSFFLF